MYISSEVSITDNHVHASDDRIQLANLATVLYTQFKLTD